MALVGFGPDGTLIAMSGLGGTGGGWLHLMDPSTFSIKTTWRAHEGAPKAVEMNDAGTLVVSGDADGVVRVWDTVGGALLHQFSVDGQAQGVAFVGDDKVAVAPSGGGLVVFDIDPARLLKTVRASVIRGFTREECERFGFIDACPTLEQLRGLGS